MFGNKKNVYSICLISITFVMTFFYHSLGITHINGTGTDLADITVSNVSKTHVDHDSFELKFINGTSDIDNIVFNNINKASINSITFKQRMINIETYDSDEADFIFIRNENSFLLPLHPIMQLLDMKLWIACLINACCDVIALLVLCFICKRFLSSQFIGNRVEEFKKLKICKFGDSIILVLGLITILCVILYFNYITFTKPYTFIDIASDSFFQTIPQLLNQSALIELYGRVPSWNFSYYLGMASGMVNLLDGGTILLGVENVIKYLGDFQVLKVVLAGLVFYLYLRKLKRTKIASILGAIGFAFCGHMVIRSSWASYGADCFVLAFLLYGFESYFVSHKKLIFISSIIILGYSRMLVFTIVYSAVLLMYAVFRYHMEHKFNLKEFMKFYIDFIMIYVGALLLTSYILVPSFENTMNGARLGTIEGNETGIQWISNYKTLLTSYFKTMSNDMFGDALSYQGSINYLEDASLYCGLLSISLVPLSFRKAEKKQRIWHAFMILLILAYCIFPPLRIAMNGFAKDTFKLSSLWIIVVILYLATKGLDNAREYGISKRYIFIPLLVIDIPLLLLLLIKPMFIDYISIYQVLVFSILYVMCLMYILNRNANLKIFLLLLITFSIEIVMNSYRDVNHRVTASNDDVTAYTKSDIVDFLNELRSSGELDLYRVDYPGGLTLPLTYNFSGTRGYIGGSGISKEVTDFTAISGNSRIKEYGFTRYFYGFTGNNEFNTSLGTKYLILEEGRYETGTVPYGYSEKYRIGKYHIYVNEYAIPMIYTYESSISQDVFEKMNYNQQRAVILDKLVTEDSDHEVISPIVGNDSIKLNVTKKSLNLDNTSFTPITLNASKQEYYMLRFHMSSDSEENWDTILTIKWDDHGIEKRYTYQTAAGEEDIEITIENDAQNVLEFITSNPTTIDNLEIYNLNETYFEFYKDNVSKRLLDDLEITKFEHDILEGNINVKNGNYLYFSIPFNENWVLSIDGKKTTLKEGNIAFMYTEISKGLHEFKLEYKKDYGKILVFTIVGLLLLSVPAFIKIGNKIVYSRSKK